MHYIDVGGGSAKPPLLSRNRIIESGSFNIGGVRLLKKGHSKRELARLKSWLKAEIAPGRPCPAAGTGRSINNILKISRKKEGKPLSVKRIKEIRHYLDSFTVEERIQVLGLRPDRADVIIESADIYLMVLKSAGGKKLNADILGAVCGSAESLRFQLEAGQICLDKRILTEEVCRGLGEWIGLSPTLQSVNALRLEETRIVLSDTAA